MIDPNVKQEGAPEASETTTEQAGGNQEQTNGDLID